MKTLRIQPGDRVELIWRDAYSPTNEWWGTVNHVREKMKTLDTRMRACGYFVAKDKNFICVAGAWDYHRDNYACGKVMYIPVSEVLEIKKF